jgi:hypothetical protein
LGVSSTIFAKDASSRPGLMQNSCGNNSRWRRALNGHVVLLSVLGLMLVSCTTSTVVDSYCLIAEPIFFSDADSEETIKQVLRENAKYDELCSA